MEIITDHLRCERHDLKRVEVVDWASAASNFDRVLDSCVDIAAGSNNRLQKVEAKSKITSKSGYRMLAFDKQDQSQD